MMALLTEGMIHFLYGLAFGAVLWGMVAPWAIQRERRAAARKPR
jgi:hypothetical protein